MNRALTRAGEEFQARADRLYDAWHSPAAIAEREANRALCNATFDAIRDRALAARDAEELKLTDVREIAPGKVVA